MGQKTGRKKAQVETGREVRSSVIRKVGRHVTTPHVTYRRENHLKHGVQTFAHKIVGGAGEGTESSPL